ncbi:MAG TPA: class I SAM-dependent methyltransferase [Terriglobales bacterium]
MDTFFGKTSVVQALRAALPALHGRVLDVGCGRQPFRNLILSGQNVTGYIGMDLGNNHYAEVVPDLVWDGNSIPLPADSVGSIVCTEVLEHCPDPARVLAECRRVLEPGGLMVATVPFLFPLHDVPHDYWRYTPYAVEMLLSSAGFRHWEIRPMGGWNAALAHMLGLWAVRSLMRTLTRRIVGRLAMPVYRYLLARDQPPANFDKPGMIVRLTFSARK